MASGISHQNVSRSIFEGHASSEVAHAIVAKVHCAQSVTVGVFHDEGVATHRHAALFHIRVLTEAVTAAIHDDFAVGIFNAP